MMDLSEPPSWLFQQGQFFSERRIRRDVCLDAGTRWDTDRQAVAYPRVSREGEILGYKLRSITNGDTFCDPGKISGADLLPWCVYSRGVPSLILLTEGETDGLCLASHAEALLGQAAAACEIYVVPGASAFQGWWAEMFRGRSVIALPDGDDAGRLMSLRIARSIPYARFVSMPTGRDVCSMVAKDMQPELASLIAAAESLDVKEIPSRSYRNIGGGGLTREDFSDRLLSEAQRETQLRRRGIEYSGLCPFHDEGTPSFMVNPGKGLWYCHGCMQGGTLIDFVMVRDGLSYGEAIDKLGETA